MKMHPCNTLGHINTSNLFSRKMLQKICDKVQCTLIFPITRSTIKHKNKPITLMSWSLPFILYPSIFYSLHCYRVWPYPTTLWFSWSMLPLSETDDTGCNEKLLCFSAFQGRSLLKLLIFRNASNLYTVRKYIKYQVMVLVW